MEKIIEIKNLTKNYGKHRGVNNVSFEVNKGEIYGFLGPNGAGKSTTIRAMLGMIKYDKGDISIFGYDALNLQLMSEKQTVGKKLKGYVRNSR